MPSPMAVATAALLVVGGFFFLAGTVGLLRFPDLHTRLHALTKADNLGLGFIALGLALDGRSFATASKLALTWALVMTSSSIAAQLIASYALSRDANPAADAKRRTR